MAVTLALLEAGSLVGAVCAASLLSGHTVLADWLDVAGLLGQALALSLTCLLAFYVNDLYDLRVVRSFGEFAPRLVQSVGIVFILLAALYQLVPMPQLAEQPVLWSLTLVVGLVVALRLASYSIIQSRRFGERVLLIGWSPLARKLIEQIEAQPHRRYTIVGVADDATAGEDPACAYPLLGPLKHLEKVIEEVRPDRIVVALAERRGRLPVSELLESRVRGVAVEDGVDVYERLTGKLAIESMSPSALIFSKDFRKSRLDLALGRGVSLLASLGGLIALAPLFGLIALAIRLESRGPVFFVQERVGLHGRRFNLVKFRTMRPVNGKTSEWARDNSDRITRVGKWLRRFRLDELPQFVNILRGEMNLVGPRPHPVSNFELFSDRIPYYWLRALVRPGVTGWAQVQYGYANDLDEETEKMRYDLFYIKHLSLELDLRILFETVRIVSCGREQR
jgi:exopolysaccharide biosynthesis polyprenyl glycosylphosphotransferase